MKRILDKFKAIRNYEVALLNRGRISILVQLLIAFSVQSVVLMVIYSFQEASVLGDSISLFLLLLILGLILVFIHHYFFRIIKKTSRKERILTAHLKKSLLSAEKTAAAKTNFLATMSHELRTPLNAVIGMTNILLEDNPSSRQKENLEILSFSAENLMSTINNILSFNRLDAGMEQLEKAGFRLDLLLDNVFGLLKLRILNNDLVFKLDMDDRIKGMLVMGDQIRLAQVFFNLAGNAIKFTTSGFVKIRAVLVMADSEMLKVRFEIEDSGIGIPELQQAQVFEPYFRAERQTSNKSQGTGLGLSIARRLVDLHGGVLNFKSEEGKGTFFSFELSFPLLHNELAREEIISEEFSTKIGHLRILIAEDNPVNVMVLQKTLSRWGLVADVAENGQLALNAMLAKSYDLIFMDINMPVMNGFEASKQIRELSDPQKNKVYIIALTASIGMSLEEHPEIRYLDDFLLKPFSVEQLKAKLEQSARMEFSNYTD